MYVYIYIYIVNVDVYFLCLFIYIYTSRFIYFLDFVPILLHFSIIISKTFILLSLAYLCYLQFIWMASIHLISTQFEK